MIQQKPRYSKYSAVLINVQELVFLCIYLISYQHSIYCRQKSRKW